MQATPETKKQEVLKAVGKPSSSWSRRLIRFGIAGLILLYGVAGLLFWTRGSAPQRPEYSLAAVQRGNLQGTVTATGSLRGLDTVVVGAEVSGTIKAVYVDYNDTVKAGQVLAELDLQELSAALDQTRAQLAASNAEYDNRQASAREANVVAKRTEQLAQDGLASDQDLVAAKAAAERAESSSRSALAQISLTRASLKSAETRLQKTKIVSPIDGVVLARSVEVGATVAASLQAPTLFTLARDLKEMELIVNIDEADIGQVRAGQAATFTVDAYPNRVFQAELTAVHNVGTLVENVVTYEARLAVRNDDLALKPDMTATATIVTESRTSVLLLPAAALRFSPPVMRAEGGRGPGLFRLFGPPPGGMDGPREDTKGPAVWIAAPMGPPRSVSVKAGLSDGQFTELVEGDLTEGQQVIVDMKQVGVEK